MRATLLLAAFAILAVPASAQDVLDLGSPGAIPDGVYDGTLGSMLCAVVDNSGGTIVDVTDVELDIAIRHTWVGDLTIKIESPNGTILTPLARPGADLADGAGECCGSSSGWEGLTVNFANGNPTSAEDLGTFDNPVCSSGGAGCAYFPFPDAGGAPGVDFDDFDGENATTGAWSVCVGDGAGADEGFFDSGTLTIDGNIPVELVSFTGTANGTDVSLNWETASETNNAGFEVQMQDGENWTVLSFVNGHGTTTEAQTYAYTATDVGVGMQTFRLKQIDFDGAFEYSGEVEVSVETPGTHLISSAYPNPFNPQSQFTLAVAQEQHVTAELFNTLGQRVAVLFDGSVEANQSQLVTIDGAGLASGMYVVRVTGERFSAALSVTLLK